MDKREYYQLKDVAELISVTDLDMERFYRNHNHFATRRNGLSHVDALARVREAELYAYPEEGEPVRGVGAFYTGGNHSGNIVRRGPDKHYVLMADGSFRFAKRKTRSARRI